ncbi:MAG TPA: ATP-binding cassette domain-containing protein [Geminicoccaceae bacterium]|nr:ATP-binding cassette domain-containing protein [Geminicoccaceae bacterium]
MLILDEPTAVLTPQETDQLFGVLEGLAARGLAIVFISHKLGEVMRLSRRVAVLRGGRKVTEVATRDTDRGRLAEAMVGRPVAASKREPLAPGAPVLELEGVVVPGGQGRQGLDGVSLTVRAGEILGIAGVSGNGQQTLSALLSGLVLPVAGTVRHGTTPLPLGRPASIVARGIGRIPEDRHEHGVVPDMEVRENLVLESLREPAFQRRGVLRWAAIDTHAEQLIRAYEVRCEGPRQRTRLLSGGNIQKLILGRVLERAPGFVLADQPTRGLDIGAVGYVHDRLLEARGRGAAVLLISEDLDELRALADQIAVMYRGRLGAPLPTESVTVQELGLMMAGQELHAA